MASTLVDLGMNFKKNTKIRCSNRFVMNLFFIHLSRNPWRGKLHFGILFSCNVLHIIWPSVMFSSLSCLFLNFCISGTNLTPSYLCLTPPVALLEPIQYNIFYICVLFSKQCFATANLGKIWTPYKFNKIFWGVDIFLVELVDGSALNKTLLFQNDQAHAWVFQCGQNTELMMTLLVWIQTNSRLASCPKEAY